MKTATVEDIVIEGSSPVRIGGLEGYATLGRGKGTDSGTDLTVYQVVLYDESGYSIIQGIAPSSERERYLPIFEKVAGSFRMK